MVTVNVSDKSPKAIIRQLIIEGRGPRDHAGMVDLLDEWINGTPEVGTFGAYCRRQAWTLGQILSLLEYQCAHLFGDGVDAAEFNTMWRIFGPIVRDQGLLDVEAALLTLATIPAPAPGTRAASLLVR
jgi:hypothetical protein